MSISWGLLVAAFFVAIIAGFVGGFVGGFIATRITLSTAFPDEPEDS